MKSKAQIAARVALVLIGLFGACWLLRLVWIHDTDSIAFVVSFVIGAAIVEVLSIVAQKP